MTSLVQTRRVPATMKEDIIANKRFEYINTGIPKHKYHRSGRADASLRPTTNRVHAAKRHRRFPTSFCGALRRCPPPVPPSLLRFTSDTHQDKVLPGSQAGKKKDNIGPGRVKVLLRVCPEAILRRRRGKNANSGAQSPSQDSILRVEGNHKHVTIFDSTIGLQSAQKRVGVSAPKLYAFDTVFPEASAQAEVCSVSLIDVIHAVVQGADGAVFCYGHAGLGKTYSLLGSDANERELGIIPCGISWLYRAISAIKDKSKGRYSVRVSAIEVHGRTEELKDLLKDLAKVAGGHSRLHFIDLGSCERTLVKTPNSLTLSLNSLGHVIMAIINNSKHVPFKESKLTLVLQELLGNFNCRTVMLAHVAKGSEHYADTLSTVQMASRIHRVIIKKKSKSSSGAGAMRGVGHHIPKSLKSHRSKGTDDESVGTSSGIGETSGSEVSCDTVIYVRPNGVPYSDRELTDNEGPPTTVPIRTSPHNAKKLSKITERERKLDSLQNNRIIRKTSNEEEFDIERVLLPKSARNSPSRQHIDQRCMSATQIKMQNHSKLLNSIHGEGNRISKLPKPSRSAQAIKQGKEKVINADKRSTAESHNFLLVSQNHAIEKDSGISKSYDRGAKKRSKIPPPPPPRLSTTRITSSNVSNKSHGENFSHNKSSMPTVKTTNNSKVGHETRSFECFDRDRPFTKLKTATSSYSNYVLPVTNVSESFTPSKKHSHLNRHHVREEPDGCDVITNDPHQKRKRQATAVTNMSYCDVNINRTPDPKLDRCIQDFNNVLNIMGESSSASDARDAITTCSDISRDVTSVNENNPESESDDDTITSDGEASEGDDVIGVDFYCLSFTTKNPLIPLSKRSFVREVTQNRRVSMQQNGADDKSSDDASQDGIRKRADSASSVIQQEESQRGAIAEDNFVPEEISDYHGKMKRSGTFDVESNLPISLLPDSSENSDASNSCSVQELESPEDVGAALSEASTISSPSQVILYDSSSLEINYVKPKSFIQKDKSIAQAPRPNDNNSWTKHSPNGTEAPSCGQKRFEPTIVVSGSESSNGAQLSLVKTNGESSTLQLVITSTTTTPITKSDSILKGRQSGGREMLKSASCCHTPKGSPNKLSKWGLKRFGNKKDKAVPNRLITDCSTGNKAMNKVENHFVQTMKATSPSNQSFVSKLLSPKTKRNQKRSHDVPADPGGKERIRGTNLRVNYGNAWSNNSHAHAEQLFSTTSPSKGIDRKNRGLANGAQNGRNRFGFTKKTKS